MKNFEKDLCVIEDGELENVVGGTGFFDKYGKGLKDLNKALFVPKRVTQKNPSNKDDTWFKERRKQFTDAHNNMQDTGVKVAVYGTEAAGAGVLGTGVIAAVVGAGVAVKKFALSK